MLAYGILNINESLIMNKNYVVLILFFINLINASENITNIIILNSDRVQNSQNAEYETLNSAIQHEQIVICFKNSIKAFLFVQKQQENPYWLVQKKQEDTTSWIQKYKAYDIGFDYVVLLPEKFQNSSNLELGLRINNLRTMSLDSEFQFDQPFEESTFKLENTNRLFDVLKKLSPIFHDRTLQDEKYKLSLLNVI